MWASSIKDTPPATTKPLNTPKRVKRAEEGNTQATKRIKVESGQNGNTQLLIAPSIGREIAPSVPPPQLTLQDDEEEFLPIEESAEAGSSTRTGLVITRCVELGRVLAMKGYAEEVERIKTTAEVLWLPRTTTIPVISADESGLAHLTTNEVLESEIAWLERGGRGTSLPSSPDPVQLQTPTMLHEDLSGNSPVTRANKTQKRMQAFLEGKKQDEPMVCTRIAEFGRVAVRKDVAARFLELDRNSAVLVEEIPEDDKAHGQELL